MFNETLSNEKIFIKNSIFILHMNNNNTLYEGMPLISSNVWFTKNLTYDLRPIKNYIQHSFIYLWEIREI